MSDWKAPQDLKAQFPPLKRKIAVITARFNDGVTSKLKEGALSVFARHEITNQVSCFDVPGAYEIPLIAKLCFDAGYEAVVALGAVIKGESAHFHYVCQSVERGCTELQIQYGRPVVFGVLTVDSESQALERVGGRHGHKGSEAAEVCLEMMRLGEYIRNGTT